uniref:GrpE protein homolog n=1 Tax=Chromera velia CCMP2878 TaxID=1169474 RepID=A0A0G4FN93_9ALVE|mmetsp:Transcript_29041/g.56883  ORF Transcript_29041/g.56883 Transcript_29041/m.56883 type:complete len:261 (+) Transcript_29041:153-935(+)|eukprot:Cvel_17825.t1-p1 / transcript=Cvel_17825.t1 / gene=Cvel_17825 / organism=Chromera_velia_CCMP2878 / gene_product=Protein GrpE, putative / transcript_product=Protein GrpE, putative / location=Cvel_scaffold1444:31731-34103(-) / protein_length=260 / sequence_SO=supercontig / SO=protein_coding / is_pseudo=false
MRPALVFSLARRVSLPVRPGCVSGLARPASSSRQSFRFFSSAESSATPGDEKPEKPAQAEAAKEETPASSGGKEKETEAAEVSFEKLKECEKKYQDASAKVKEMQDKLLRTLAEMENLRTRHRTDLDNSNKYAVAKFASSMVEVADTLELASKSIEAERLEEDTPLKTIAEGVKMTETILLKAFENHGIVKDQPEGNLFDPSFHEAMFQMEDKSKVRGTIFQVMQPGYRIHERVLRAAKVGTTTGGPAPPPPPPKEKEGK